MQCINIKLVTFIASGDGMGSSMPPPRRPRWYERLAAPLKFGLEDLAPTFAKLGSAVTVSAAGRKAAEQLGAQLVASHFRYQATAKVATGAAQSVLGQWQRQAALQVGGWVGGVHTPLGG